MIPTQKLAELASLYEEYSYSPDPFTPEVKRAEQIFRSECAKLYEQETVEFRRRMTLDGYIGAVVVVEINKYLDNPQTPYAAI
ncbi:MAG: hypothetical protein V7609_64 [Verrucomicrobiota bacterium]